MFRAFLVLLLPTCPLLGQDAEVDAAFRARQKSMRDSFRDRSAPAVKKEFQELVQSAAQSLKLTNEQQKALSKAADAAVDEVYKSIDVELARAENSQDLSEVLRARITDMRLDGVLRSATWKQAIARELSKQQQAEWAADLAKRKAAERRAVDQAAAVRMRAAPASMNTIVNAYKRRLELSEKFMSDQLRDELMELRTVCSLSEDQSTRLETAIKGAVHRTFSGKVAQLEEIVREAEEKKDTASLMTTLRDFTRPLTTPMTTLPELWTRTVEKTLTTAQKEKLETERRAREKFRKEVWSHNVINGIDQAVHMTAAQRKQLYDALQTLEAPETPSRMTAGSTLVTLLPAEFRDRVLKDILTEEQFARAMKPSNSRRVPVPAVRRVR